MTQHIRSGEIPSISDYAHWGEEAAAVWYEENKYDMMYGTSDEGDFYDREEDYGYPEDWCDEHEQFDCGEDHEDDEPGPFDDEPPEYDQMYPGGPTIRVNPRED